MKHIVFPNGVMLSGLTISRVSFQLLWPLPAYTDKVCPSCEICKRGPSRTSVVLDRNSTCLHPFCSVLLDVWYIVDYIKATPKVTEDICAAFNIDAAAVFRTTTYRKK